ncbi:MAG TPA: hypothetical protein VI933_00040 [archaeon]|nr:hypothetical protein [archaeon]
MPKPSLSTNQISEKKAAMLLATFAVTVHIIWSALVALGFAQAYVNWMLGMHFITAPVVTVGTFDIVTALSLIVSVAIVAYIAGFIFAFVWNRIFVKFA